MFGVVAEHAAELRHQAVQRDFRYESIGPQLRMDVGLRNGGRPSLEQDGQEIECLAGQVTLDTVTPHLARGGIKLDPLTHWFPIYAAE